MHRFNNISLYKHTAARETGWCIIHGLEPQLECYVAPNAELAVLSEGGFCVYLTSHSDIHIRRWGIQIVKFQLVAHSARNSHNKPGCLTYPVNSTDTREHFSWEEPVHIQF